MSILRTKFSVIFLTKISQIANANISRRMGAKRSLFRENKLETEVENLCPQDSQLSMISNGKLILD